MPEIRKIVSVENHKTYLIVWVELDEGDEPYKIYVGGAVEAYHHKGVNKAYVKRNKSLTDS